MSDITDRVAYLRGLAEGCKLDTAKDEGMLISKMLEVLDSLAHENEELRQSLDELNDYVESIDEDLSELEEAVLDEDDDEDDDEDEEGDDEDDDDGTVEYACPYCGETMVFDVERFDFDEDYLCPNCHKPLFPEEDVEDEDDGDMDK